MYDKDYKYMKKDYYTLQNFMKLTFNNISKNVFRKNNNLLQLE